MPITLTHTYIAPCSEVEYNHHHHDGGHHQDSRYDTDHDPGYPTTTETTCRGKSNEENKIIGEVMPTKL